MDSTTDKPFISGRIWLLLFPFLIPPSFLINLIKHTLINPPLVSRLFPYRLKRHCILVNTGVSVHSVIKREFCQLRVPS